jgi:predicted  nucleic acid-binding Zn-ribbon protein
MAVTAESLRELHRIHRQLADLRERLERGPRQIKAREINVSKLTLAQSEAHETVQKTRIAADQKQLELKASEGRIDDWKTKLNSCSSNKEYQTLLEQIAAAEMAGSVLADEILEALERIDQLGVAVSGADELLKSGQGELLKCRNEVAEDTEIANRDISRLEIELAEAESNLPAEFKADYQRVIRGKGAEGMAEMEGQVCSGCGQQITLNMQNNLMMDKLVFCTSCGCLLYLGEKD